MTKRFGILFQPGALWLGAHYSRYDRRWCINLLPCVTVWIVLKGGRPPRCVHEVSETSRFHRAITKDMVQSANQQMMEKGAVARFRQRQRTMMDDWRQECENAKRAAGF